MAVCRKILRIIIGLFVGIWVARYWSLQHFLGAVDEKQ
jgi:ABC-type proline/glycine betaine transport system permease subunit